MTLEIVPWPVHRKLFVHIEEEMYTRDSTTNGNLITVNVICMTPDYVLSCHCQSEMLYKTFLLTFGVTRGTTFLIRL